MRILIAGGGTGGHVYPAVAIGKELKYRHPDWEISFAGRHDSIEGRIIPAEGFELHELFVRGYERYYSRLKKMKVMATAAKSFVDSMGMLGKLKPDVVVGTGGYICGPIVMAACVRGIPTLISEQNVIPGFTIKTLSRYVKTVCLPFEDARGHMARPDRCVLTGNPVRREFGLFTREMSRSSLKLTHGERLILSFGGSLGANTINNAVMGLAQSLGRFPGTRLIHIAGRDAYPSFMEKLRESGLAGIPGVEILEYSNEMPVLLNAADLVISRSGAMSVSEINYVGVACVYVPHPASVFDHQTKNAAFNADRGAAVLIADKDCSQENLSSTVIELLRDPKRLKSMSDASRAIGIRDSAERIAVEIEKLAAT